MRAINSPIIQAADASIDQASAALASSQIFYISMQVVMTGTASGTLKLQFSNDPCEGQSPTATPTHWNDITGASVTLTGTAGSFGILKTDLSYRFIRAVYTHNNGQVGTVTATINGMGQ